MKTILTFGLIIFAYIGHCQIMSGLAESKNLFFIEVEPSVLTIDIDNFFIDQKVWFCEFYIIQKSDTLRHTIAFNPVADTVQTKKITKDIGLLLKRKGEIIIRGVNKDPEFDGFLMFDHIMNIDKVKSYSYYSKHSDNYPKSFLAFSSKYEGDLEKGDYECRFVIKTKQSVITGKFRIPKNEPDKLDATSNWFDHKTGKGYYNGHKLIVGPRGGIFYVQNGNKVYVTYEFKK